VNRTLVRPLAALALPIAFQQFMLAVSSSIDALMLGALGQDKLAGVSLAVQVQFVFNIFIGSLTIGMSVLTAQYWGAGDRERVRSVLALVLRFALTVSILFTVAAATVPTVLMSVLTDQPELIAIGAVYLRASALAFLLTGATQIYLCLMKNTGAAARGMTISVVGVLVHIALNVVLIFGPGPFPRLGVTGAAIALVVSRLLELAWAYGYSLRPGRPRARWASLLRSQGFLERQFWRYTLPVLGNMIAFGGGFTVYTMLMGRMGTDAVAANSIATIVKDLVICFCLGLGNGAGILIGGMLGRGETSLARDAGRMVSHLAIGAGVATGLVILAIRPLVLLLADLTPTAEHYLSVMLVVCAVYVIGKSINSTTIAGIFPAGGDTRFGLICDVITMWVVVIPLGYLAVFVWHWPVLWVYLLLNIDEFLKLPFVLARFRTYRWVRNLTTPASADPLHDA
jgi:putative MATE family efflux protein